MPIKKAKKKVVAKKAAAKKVVKKAAPKKNKIIRGAEEALAWARGDVSARVTIVENGKVVAAGEMTKDDVLKLQGGQLPQSFNNELMQDALMSRIANDKLITPQDKLDNIKMLAKRMRDIEFEIADKEASVKELKAKLVNLSMKELPDLFAEYKIPGIKLDAEGNMPSVEVNVVPFYKAVLPKDENDEIKPEGPQWLEDNDFGDLIKRVFTIQLPMDSEKIAVRLRNGFVKAGIEFDEKRTVPWTTLTAFVKEQFESARGRKDLPLEKLGAIVGKIARIKTVKEK